MYLKTHLMFGIFMILLFVEHVSSKLVFIGAVVIATILPDLDSNFSSYGRHLIFRPLQFFVKHRGVIHSLTSAVVLSILIAIFWPVGVFGFFLGYSVHLIIDSFTREGIQPFWPFKWKSSGPFISGGRIEEMLFLSLVIINFLVFIVMFLI